MVYVKSYIRYRKGHVHRVNSHNRKAHKKYSIDEYRQKPRYKSSIRHDERIRAKKPGRRISAYDNVYYERRFNRSDKGEYL